MLSIRNLSLSLPIAILAGALCLTGPAYAQSPYGQQDPNTPASPYGGGGQQQNPYGGGGQQQNPYGGGQQQNPYGGGQQPNPYGGGQQNPYGGGGQMPPQAPQAPQGGQGAVAPGQTFQDAFGRFRATLPQGAQAFSATYSFAVPSATVQLNIQSVTQPQMLQMTLQNFPQMVQGMGGQIHSQKTVTVGGRQAQYIVVVLKDPQSGQQMVQSNIFILANGLWVQAMSPVSQGKANDDVMNMVLQSLQTQ